MFHPPSVSKTREGGTGGTGVGAIRESTGVGTMKIFLGYASEHLAVAKDVYAFLKEAGHEVWFDKDSLIPGVEWDRERSGGQDSAELIVHLVSKEIVERKGVVNREIKQTLRLVEDQPLGALFVVVIRVEDFRLPVELTRFQYVDYFSDDWRDGLNESLERRAGQLRRSGETPATVPRREQLSSQPAATGPTLYQVSDATDRYECRGEYLAYPGAGLYWSMVNSHIQSTALADFIASRGQMRRLSLDDVPSRFEEGVPPYTWETHCEEFFARGEVVSIRFYSYSYMGGAHGNSHITSLTFLGEQFGLVDVRDLFGQDPGKAKNAWAYCKKVIAAQFGDDDAPDFDAYVGDDDESVWYALRQYNVDARGITFNFSPYSILPYAYGTIEVHVPWGIAELGGDFDDLPDLLTLRRTPVIVPL